MLTCPSCGNEEPEGSRFCGNCSTALVLEDPPHAQAEVDGRPMLRCASCGHEETEGSRFCGSCSAPLVLPDGQPPSVTTETSALSSAPTPRQPAMVERSRVEPRQSPSRTERRRLLLVVAGALALLVAGGAVAAVLSLGGGGGSTEASPTEQQPPSETTFEPPPPTVSSTLVDSVAPRLVTLGTSQAALSARLRLLRADAESFAALRQSASSLAASVVETQGFLDGLAVASADELATVSLLRSALTAHLAYAETIARFPQPGSFTDAQARAAIAQAEQVQAAYAALATAEPGLGISLNTLDHVQLLDVVPSVAPTVPAVARRTVDLVPLLVGIGPDDPLGQGRCFGPYTSRASLSVSGVVHQSGFIQCGDDANGDPSRTSGVYRFSGLTLPAGSRLVRVTGQAAIDESSSDSQRGSRVTWTVFYDDTPLCSKTVVWSGVRPLPIELDCRASSAVSAGAFDVRRLRIEQVASLASSGSAWAGLLNPKIVVEGPR